MPPAIVVARGYFWAVWRRALLMPIERRVVVCLGVALLEDLVVKAEAIWMRLPLKAAREHSSFMGIVLCRER